MFRSHAIRALALLLTSAMAVGGATTYTTPNLDSTPVGEAKPVWLGGVKFVNKGLVGVGQLAVGALDDRGDSLGSFSSFKIDPKTWRRLPDGSYGGTLFSLPDRGYNVQGTVDYPARLQRFEITFRPDYGRDPVLTPNLKLAFKATRTLLDFKGNVTTGLDSRDDTLQGFSPVPVRHGKFAVDAEGLGRHPDGTFYLSEEYGATIYHLSPQGQMLGLLTPPNAFLPRFEGKKFSGFTTDKLATEVQTGGRRDNQGYEGVDVTPDGRFLVAMLQGALRQDCPTEEENNRAYARLVVYDLQAGPMPRQPVGHYLVELPTFNTAGLGKPANKSTAQSELIALNRTDFLILARDSSGSGSGKAAYAPDAAAVGYAAAPHIYKSVLWVSTRAATNLVGTTYESGYVPAVRGSGPTLAPAYGLTAATGSDFINLLNPAQLARFGLDLNVVGSAGAAKAAAAGHRVGMTSPASLSAKWEALAIVSCLDRAYPDDYFLLVGNDNDFLTAEGAMLGKSYDATSSQPGMEIVENLNRVLVYRVTLPGYADPGLIVSATKRAPAIAAKNLRTAQLTATSFGSILKGRLAGAVRLAAPKIAADFDWQADAEALQYCVSGLPATHAAAGNLRWWFDGSIRDLSEDAGALTPALDSRSNAGALGLEWEVAPGFVFGLGLGMQDGKSNGSDGSNLSYTGRSVTSYLIGRGDIFFGSLTITSGTQDLDTIQSAGAYGSTPVGATQGRSLSAELLVGASVGEIGGWAVTPMVGLARTTAKLDAYTEAGVGGVSYQSQRLTTNTASASVEFAKAFALEGGSCTPFVRLGYESDFGGSDQTANVSVLTNGGTVGVAVTLPNADRDYVTGALGLRWKLGEFNAETSYEHRTSDNGFAENRINLSLSNRF